MALKLGEGKLKVRRIAVIAMTLAVFGFNAPVAFAEETAAKSSDWDFSIAPYIWAVSLRGDATVGGISTSIDESFIDTVSNADSVFALTLHGEAWWRERWGGFLDGTYVKLGFDNQVLAVPPGPIVPAIIGDLETEIWLVEFGGLYRAGRWPYGRVDGDRGWTLELLAGGRYTSIDQKITFKVPPAPNVNGNQSWTDPFFGGRGTFDLSERWAFILRTDIGGFGVGSDFTFNASGLFDYRYVGWGLDMDILAGYRGLYQDYSSGSGPTAFVWDIWMHGPLLAWNIRW